MKSFMGQIKTDILNLLYPLKEFNKEHPFKSYHTVVENHAFAVFAPKNETIVAAHENIVCTQKSGDKNTLYLYPDIRRMRMRHRINVNENAFRGLIHGSNVQTVLLLPFIDKKDGNRSPSCRMVIITDKCQIFHNRPENRHGKKGAETEFSESMIWDLPGKKHPSPNEKCEEYEFFYPFLPESAYEYHPAGETPKYLEVYGPDGKKEVLSRFYIPNRAVLSNPFSYMGGYEPDYMVSLIGTYLGNSTKETAGRIVVFATTDGGKNWFAKYEFNDSGASGNYGNAVRCREVELNKTSVPSQMYLVKRELVPSETEGMVLRSGQRQAINSIRWGETVELVFKEQHGLTSGDIIALKGRSEDRFEQALCNNSFGNDNYGNGVFYKVEVIDQYRIQLFELVSKSRTNLPARHIHSINRVKDGFLVATGETYPNGWLMMINLRDADNWGNVTVEESFGSTDITETGTFSIIRLNTKKESIQRILGATLIPGSEPELIYASDCSSMISRRYELKDRGAIISNSIGIFRGKLQDADDARRFHLMEEVREPSYFFKVLDNCFVFSGQRGELAIGNHNGTNWHHGRLNKPLVHYMGRTLNYFVIDGMILKLK